MNLKRAALLFPFVLFLCIFPGQPAAQQGVRNPAVPVYVDKEGVLRWTAGNKEASFFGVNYTVPFAYGYRSHKALGVDPERAIRQDVYHMARLGFNAFRVHVWDTEITDSAGNLLQNEHLRLFDFLLAELKKRNINILITPIAYWGSGYPEPDPKTAGFSSTWNKRQALVNDTAIAAQENYLKQFFRHVNPYTKMTYGKDPSVIAMEINNEPHHSGPKAAVTRYVNRMTEAVRSTGWTKPVFYNISESPAYADAVAQAKVEGHSFQWYPTGLVANYTLQGNYLPHVDRYRIPFLDTIPAFRNRARMVYEFDAGDVAGSYLYPAMARSFRGAGFQWATQFAYDPLATAYANTEYQTHFVNLAYTPSKAISLMIAGEAFRRLSRNQAYGVYPADSLFGPFRVSYRANLSEMNTADAFLHSNPTDTKPLNPGQLKRIAGVGSSPVVTYEGSGAYFLDKIGEGLWRLEVMPDALVLQDPFARASPKKEVVRVQWATRSMRLLLPGFERGLTIRGLNEGNGVNETARDSRFGVRPGTYLLAAAGKAPANVPHFPGVLEMQEFVAPQPVRTEVYVQHTAPLSVSANGTLLLKAVVAGVDSSDKVTLFINRYYGAYKTLPMQPRGAARYEASVPAELLVPGLLQYRIVVQQGSDYSVFPGNHKGYPFAWDNHLQEYWETAVALPGAPLWLFDPLADRRIKTYPPFRRGFTTDYLSSETGRGLVLHLGAASLLEDSVIGFTTYIGDKMEERAGELSLFDTLVIRARAGNSGPVAVKVTLLTKDGLPFSATATLNASFSDLALPVGQFAGDAALLLPRPYPGFQPLWFRPAGSSPFRLEDAERLEVTIGAGILPAARNGAHHFEVEAIYLKNGGK